MKIHFITKFVFVFTLKCNHFKHRIHTRHDTTRHHTHTYSYIKIWPQTILSCSISVFPFKISLSPNVHPSLSLTHTHAHTPSHSHFVFFLFRLDLRIYSIILLCVSWFNVCFYYVFSHIFSSFGRESTKNASQQTRLERERVNRTEKLSERWGVPRVSQQWTNKTNI